MIQLGDLLSLPLLDEMIEQGYVVRRHHNDHPLAILNYTDKAQFDNEWNPVTRQCRGLIYNTETLEVVARPFKKFFNYDQPGADEITALEDAYVTDKMDGSLGIIYCTPAGDLAVATRGSFHSEQAEWATAWLREHEYVPNCYLNTQYAYTDLVEIIYPENRIVVDYGRRAELVYLGTIEIGTGEFHRFAEINLTYAHDLGYSLKEALQVSPRENAEGVVVMTPDGRAVKIKQEDYLVKHRARFSLTPMRVWEAWSSGMTLAQFVEGLPDEFHVAVMKEWGSIETEAIVREFVTLSYHAQAPDAPRKEQAAWIFENVPEFAGELFALLDDNDEKFDATIRRAVKPTGPEASKLIAA